MRDSPPDLDLIARLLRQVLAVTKARSVKLGGRRPNQHKLDPSLGTATLVRASDEFAARVAPIALELHKASMSLRQIVAELDKRGIRTMRGGAWTAASARNVLLRHERISIGHAQLLTIKQTPGPPGREVAADHAGD
jgi:recombinase